MESSSGTVVYDKLPSVTVEYPEKPVVEVPTYERMEYTPKTDEEIETLTKMSMTPLMERNMIPLSYDDIKNMYISIRGE